MVVTSGTQQVCKRWNRVINMPSLWKENTRLLGAAEGMSDVTEMMETLARHKQEQDLKGTEGRRKEELLIDWKKLYRNLMKFLSTVKDLVMERVISTGEELLLRKMESKVSKTRLLSKLTLQEMLLISKLVSMLGHHNIYSYIQD